MAIAQTKPVEHIRDPQADAALEESFLAVRQGRDPNPYYHELRNRSRVYFAPDRNMWVLTGFAEVDQVLRSPLAQLQFAKRMDKQRADWRDHPANANLEVVIAFVDGEPHQKIRKALMPAWTTSEMERVRPMLRERVERLVDDYIADGGGNFHDKVALPMAEETIFRLFGMDENGPKHLRRLVDEFLFVHDYDATPAQLKRADEAAAEMREFWKVEFKKRVTNPGDDMLSGLARNPGLTEEEGMLIAESIYVGGYDATALTSTTGMWLLLNHPEELERARRDPAALERVPGEVVRMAGAVPMTLRVAADDIRIGDTVIQKDDLIGLGLVAANRDPVMFANPDRFDLTRPPPRSMTFSSGVHTCLGQILAKMELFELYRAMLARAKTIELVEARFRAERQAALGIDLLNLKVS
jgi:pimeloyl-[acyl-carrier protein] synthase